MSQNLIITNNRESEYVEFNVNIPDGYNKFRLEYLNGSVINQNYLKVGDTITFKFANNPIRYDIPKGAVNLIYGRDTGSIMYQYTTASDPTEYKFLELDVFKYQKLVYIPIYQCWSNTYGMITYIINPCDRNFLKEQPTPQQPDVLIDSTDGVDTYVSFTGQYCLAFDSTPIDKIPDQTITIGESISNSKTRPVDMGSYQLSNNVVNEVQVNTVTTNTYNYGSVWRYTVSNQVLKHTETIDIEEPSTIPSPMYLVLGTKDDATNEITAVGNYTILPSYRLSSDASTNKSPYVVYRYNDISEDHYKVEDLGAVYKTLHIVGNTTYTMELPPFIAIKDSNNQYSLIPPNWRCKGSDLRTNGIIGKYKNGSEIALDSGDNVGNPGYIISDWYYTGRECTYIVTYKNASDKWVPLPNTGPQIQINLGNAQLQFFRFNTIYTVTDTGGRTRQIKIIATNNANTPYKGLYLCGMLEKGSHTITYQINVGVSSLVNLYSTELTISNVTSDLLQLTDNSTLNNTEDLYVTAVHDRDGQPGIRISAKPMRNIKHTVRIDPNEQQLTQDTHPYNYLVSNSNIQWVANGAGTTTMDLQAFIPVKTNKFLHQLTEGSERSGWFIIGDITYGAPAVYIADNVCEVYLATGHETLNVEQPKEDDKKFKTFNGTLIFDRSNTKITRLFSNDLTGACLGYLNDILAAKLSRYYFCCNYNVWNSFLDTKQQNINFTMDLSFLDKLYNNSKFFTGYHETWMSNASDLVKLIGSENVVNNCMSSLYPEEQQYKCLITYNDQYRDEEFPDPSTRTDPFYYKLFHFYTGGLTDYPYAGVGDWDNATESTVGGLNLMYVPTNRTSDNEILNESRGQFCNNIGARVCDKPIFVNDVSAASLFNSSIYRDSTDNKRCYSNSNTYLTGSIETLPVFRIYRNSNFEQTDLTITTGGIKLLHPIYLQSTPRMLVNNILYMFDTAIEYLLKQYGSITNADNTFGYIGVLVQQEPPLADDVNTLFDFPNEHPMLRFSVTNNANNNGDYIAASLDSMMILNYMHTTSINEYQSIKELADSLPTAASNEEVIADLTTNSIETNVQLFSYKYFNFLSEVNQFAMVVFNSMYVETVPFNTDILSLYWNLTTVSQGKTITNNELIAELTTTIQGYINNSLSFNNIKTCKVFICKLGEFLDFPRILYAGCNSYNNTVNVTVWNYDSTKYKSPITTNVIRDPDGVVTGYYTSNVDRPEQKVNTTLYGVMFRYHQLSHGYQNFPNELTNEYLVSKSLGNRTFTLVLYDEYGRRIPNEDTNQGFKNNLYIELVLE